MISVLSRYTPSAGSSVGRKRVYPLSEEQQAKKRPKETKVEAPAERAHYHTHRINSFGQMCHRHAGINSSSFTRKSGETSSLTASCQTLSIARPWSTSTCWPLRRST